MEKLPRRKQNRLSHYDYSSDGAYFVTICTWSRRCYLADIVDAGEGKTEVVLSRYGIFAVEEMNSIEERYAVRVDGWVIMPNHVHMIVVMQGSRATARVAPTGEAGRQPLGRIIGAYKSLVDHKCRIAGFEGLLWQRNYYEHVIRSEEDLMKIREYIQENPWKWKEDEMYIDNSL